MNARTHLINWHNLRTHLARGVPFPEFLDGRCALGYHSRLRRIYPRPPPAAPVFLGDSNPQTASTNLILLISPLSGFIFYIPDNESVTRKARKPCTPESAEMPVYFSPTPWENSIELVKWPDGDSTENTQHKPEEPPWDLSHGGSFIGCAGRSGGNSRHSGSAGGCAASRTRIQRSSERAGPARNPSSVSA